MISTNAHQMNKPPRTRLTKKKQNRRRRLVAYGLILCGLCSFWSWVPWNVDLLPRKLPPMVPVDPDSSVLFSPNARIVVVTAHPDDSEFYIGGTLTNLAAAGAELHHIVCTDGDKGYYFWTDPTENRIKRRAEQRKASSTWNAREIVFLGFPDGRLHAGEGLVSALVEQFERIRPDYVLGFDGEYPPRVSHQDHRRAGEAVQRAFDLYGKAKWLMRFSTLAPNSVINIDKEWEAKKKLLTIHASQFHGERLTRVTNMVESSAIEDGERINATYGEGFRCSQSR